MNLCFFVCLCWFCKRRSSFLFVYVGFINEALRFCSFCSFGKQSSSFLFVYVEQSKKRSYLRFFLFVYGKRAHQYNATHYNMFFQIWLDVFRQEINEKFMKITLSVYVCVFALNYVCVTGLQIARH